MLPMSVLHAANRSVRRAVSSVFAGDSASSALAEWRLKAGDVERLAAAGHRAGAAVAVIAVVCNWRPAGYREGGPDFLDVWAVADDSLRPQSVVLHGTDAAPDGLLSWRDIGEFTRSSTIEIDGRRAGIYHFSGLPVDEFVVRLTDHHGNTHYDSNGGYRDNYRLSRYQGLQTNCLRTNVHGDWLFVFPRLVSLTGGGGVAEVGFDD